MQMMSDRKVLDLICDIIAFINSEDFDASIRTLSEVCCIPIEYTRRCILTLIQNNVLSACISGEDPNSYDSDFTFMDEYLDDESKVSSDILLGKYDHYVWTIDLKVLSPDEEQLLGLTALEYGAIQSLGESGTSFKHNAIYEIKDNITKIGKSIRKNQAVIQTALNNHSAISFNYRNNSGTIETLVGFPITLSTNVADNWIYFELANDNNTYRLDRVTDNIKLQKNFGPFPKIKENPNKKYMWGSYFAETAVPEHVKIAITDTSPNILRKIRNDIRHRDGLCSFYEKNGIYYYEDDIIGIPEFQRWIRGYGSSIQVLEPIYLKNRILDAAKRTLQLYETSEKWLNL